MSLGIFGLGGTLWANRAIIGSDYPPVKAGDGKQTCSKCGYEYLTDTKSEKSPSRTEVLLVLGATLNENNTHGWWSHFQPEKKLVRIDINPNNVRGMEYYEELVIGDIKAFLFWMKNNKSLFHDALKNSQHDRKIWIDEIKNNPGFVEPITLNESDDPEVHPAKVILELRKACKDRHTVLVVDSGAHTFFTAHYWKSYFPNEFLLLSTTGPMGYGIPMGIGAKLARPKQPCVCVVGDGSMLMGGMELYTAVRYNIPIVVVVINNSSLGNVYLPSRKKDKKVEELTEIPTQNWAAFAESLGAGGIIVKQPDELAGAFKEAINANKPFLIDVRCDRECPTPNTSGAI